MEPGNISKPAAPAASTATAQADHLAAAGAVKTELAPDAAVQQAERSPAVRLTPGDDARFRASLNAALREVVERNIDLDPRTRELVFQTVNKETGEVIRQFPEEMILRLRAFARDMRAAEDKARGGGDVPHVEKLA